jgi:hypothetical protein
MKKAIILLLLLSLASAQFEIESVHVTISDIESDGSAQVKESIKFIIKGSNAKSMYDSGFQTVDDLSVWLNTTGLKQVRQHLNPAVVSISSFRLQPQPRSGCNAFLDLCHGELIFDYKIGPVYNDTEVVNTTGLFYLESYKPRTTRYKLNPNALSFKKTEGGNIILDPDTTLTIELPQAAKDIKINPSPSSYSSGEKKPSWNDVVLVSFSVVFEVEESIDKEVEEFFSDLLSNFQKTVRSQHGMAFLAILAILIGSYVYINISKKGKED